MLRNHKPLAQISLVTLLILGCLFVLYPFLAAILFAAVLVVTTWPAYALLRRLSGSHDTLAALLMTCLLILGLLAPTVLLAMGLSDAVHMLVTVAGQWFSPGAQPPGETLMMALRAIPYVGDHAATYWQKLAANREELTQLLQSLLGPARHMAFASITLVGNGILQLSLVIFIAFFLYRDGVTLADLIRDAAARLAGALGKEMLTLARNTVTGVMVGIVGTALAQSLVALLGFVVAGVPGALLLAMATFFLSMVPVGPPLIWGGAAFWLYQQGETGWAIFMVIYGLAVISSVDNFVKPILISRSASLPILLIALGVFGGILAFGFVGIFLGPTLLALGQVLFLRWAQRRMQDNTG